MNDALTRGFSIGVLVTAGLSVGCGDDPEVGPTPDSGVDAGTGQDAGTGTDGGGADAGRGRPPVITRISWRPQASVGGEQCTPGEPWVTLIEVSVEDPDTPAGELRITGRVGNCLPRIEGRAGQRTFEVTCQELGRYDASLTVSDAIVGGNTATARFDPAVCEIGTWVRP